MHMNIYHQIRWLLLSTLLTASLTAQSHGKEHVKEGLSKEEYSDIESVALREISTSDHGVCLNDYREKDAAISILGQAPGTNHVNILIQLLSYTNPQTGDAPAIAALTEKGRSVVPSLKTYVQKASNTNNMNSIFHAGLALEAILGSEEYFGYLYSIADIIDRDVLQMLFLRSAGIGYERK